MNILFPIAGHGSRFKKQNINTPKPLIKFKGRTYLEWAICSLKIKGNYFVVVNSLDDAYIKEIQDIGSKNDIKIKIVDIERSTLGQAETCLVALQKLNLDENEPLLISNCDHILAWNPIKFSNYLEKNSPDALVTLYDHKKIAKDDVSPYSHIELDKNGLGVRLAEKKAISEHQLNGIFYWKKISLFTESANKLMKDNSDDSFSTGIYSKVKEKYIAPTFNYLIKDNKKVLTFKMHNNEFISLGSPEEVFINIAQENVRKAVEDLKKGKPIVMVDDYDREFEGDIVIAAEKANEQNILFALRHARGLMCLPCTQEKLDQFKIPMMHSNGGDELETPFATSIDAIEGVTTGMSVSDRLKTIKTFLSNDSSPKSLAQPGHLFPLRARKGLLSERRGHTEGCVEILKLAGLEQVGIIIEIMDDNGNMIKGEDLKNFSDIYNLSFVSIEELANYVYNDEESKTPLIAVDFKIIESMIYGVQN